MSYRIRADREEATRFQTAAIERLRKTVGHENSFSRCAERMVASIVRGTNGTPGAIRNALDRIEDTAMDLYEGGAREEAQAMRSAISRARTAVLEEERRRTLEVFDDERIALRVGAEIESEVGPIPVASVRGGQIVATQDGIDVIRSDWCSCDDGRSPVFYSVRGTTTAGEPMLDNRLAHGWACAGCRKIRQTG